jgi:hypothetical protein
MSYLEQIDWRQTHGAVSEGHTLIGGAAPDGDDLFSRIKPAILETLDRLEALPRDHPFWRNTNKRPTIHKLSDFSSRILHQNPADEGALWYSAALAVIYCDNGFGSQSWRSLHAIEKLQARWPIEAACLVALTTGVLTIDPLVVLLWELGLQAEGHAAFLELYPSDSTIYEWGALVVPLLVKRPSEQWWNAVREWKG